MATPQADRSDGARVLVVEHEAACPPALLGAWLTDAGLALEPCRPWRGDALPRDPAAFDGLLVLGGSMGAHDDDSVPWLPPLKELLRGAVAAGVPVLGVCLGHQLLAAALGGEVVVNPRGQQVGVLDVGWLPEAADDPLLGPLVGSADRGVQWNRDVVGTLPDGAASLAVTGLGELQAARFGPRAWGVQVHPEVDRSIVAAWVGGARDDYLERGIDPEVPLAAIEAEQPGLEATWRALATGFADQVRAAAGVVDAASREARR